MPRAARTHRSVHHLVHEIRKIRVKRFFFLSDKEIEELSNQHETLLPFLYEIYRRYGEKMDARMRSAVAVYMLSKNANFETVYGSLKEDGSNRKEILEMVRRGKPLHN
jgi:hypothetical protein